MVNLQKFFRVLTFLLALFCGFLLCLFIVQNLDLVFEPVFHKSYSGRGAGFRIPVAVLVFLLSSLLCYLVFDALRRFIIKAVPGWRMYWQTDAQRSVRLYEKLSVILCLLSLLTFFVIACFFRIICDDFDFLTKLETLGMWGAVKNHYLTWSGRYLQYPMQFFLYNIPQRILFPLFTLCMLSAWVGGFFMFIRQFVTCRQGMGQKRLFSFCLSVFLTCGFLLLTPSLFTSLYWYIGGVTFSFGIAAQVLSFSFLYQYLSDAASPDWKLWLALLGTFIANGTNEMTAISMTIFSIFLVMFNPFYPAFSQKQRRGAWIYAILSFLCLVFMISTPGNFGRMSHAHHLAEEGVLNMFVKFFLNLFSGYWFFLKTILERVGLLSAFSALIFLMGMQLRTDDNGRRFLNWGAFVFFITSFCCIATNSYLYNYLPLRSMMAPTILLVIALALLMLRLGSDVSHSFQLTSGHILLCAILCFLACGGWFAEYLGPVIQFSRECDYRDAQLRKADTKASSIESCRINFFFGELQEITWDPEYIINQQVSAYYGLEQVIAVGGCADMLPKLKVKGKP